MFPANKLEHSASNVQCRMLGVRVRQRRRKSRVKISEVGLVQWDRSVQLQKMVFLVGKKDKCPVKHVQCTNKYYDAW